MSHTEFLAPPASLSPAEPAQPDTIAAADYAARGNLVAAYGISLDTEPPYNNALAYPDGALGDATKKEERSSFLKKRSKRLLFSRKVARWQLMAGILPQAEK